MVKGQKPIYRLLVILLIFPLLAGCWDRLEIEDRAVILAIAVDKAKPEEKEEGSNATHLKKNFPAPTAGLIRITVQIAVPGRIPLGAGGGDSSGKSDSKPVWVLSTTGYTLDDALMNLQQQIASSLFYGHLRVIVVSKAVAQKGIANLKDYFRRQPQVRRTAWLVVSKGNAADIMKANPQLERVPTLYLLSTLDHAVEMGKLPNDIIGLFFSASSAKGQEGYLPYLDLKKESNIEISGLAYFKNDKMVGSTTALQIGQYMLIKGMNPGGYSVIMQVPDSETAVIIQSTRRKSNINVQIKNGIPHVKLRFMIEADLREKSNDDVYLNERILKKIEENAALDTSNGIRRLVSKTQQAGSDIIGIGELVRGKLPGYWNREIKSKEKWQENYREITFEVITNIRIRRIGTKTR